MRQHPIRLQQTGDFHFLTWSCADRAPYLMEHGVMEFLEQTIEDIRRRHAFYVGGYVFMPEHLHLLVSEPKHALLSESISVIKRLVSTKFKGKRSRFWLPRYYDFNVFTNDKQVEKLRYMHRNPVARGLAAAPEEYRWSSFRHYATGERTVIEIESEWTVNWKERRAGVRAGPPTR